MTNDEQAQADKVLDFWKEEYTCAFTQLKHFTDKAHDEKDEQKRDHYRHLVKRCGKRVNKASQKVQKWQKKTQK